MKKYCPNCWEANTEIPVPCPDCDGSGMSTRDPDAVDHTCYTCMSEGVTDEYYCKECLEPFENFIPENELDESDMEQIAEIGEMDKALDSITDILNKFDRDMAEINARRRHITNAAIISTAILVGLAVALIAYVSWGI